MYNLRFCELDEEKMLQILIGKGWKEHIFTHHSSLLRWQFYNEIERRFNILVAHDTVNDSIVGMLGYIPVAHFDKNLADYKEYWLSHWYVDKDSCNDPTIGLGLLSKLTEYLEANSICGIGISDVAFGIYKAMRFETGIMNHYFIPNINRKDYKILKNFKGNVTSSTVSSRLTFKRINNVRELGYLKITLSPMKSIDYVINRYLNHPYYKYGLNALSFKNELLMIMVTRKIRVGELNCIRIVDILGDYSSAENIFSLISDFLSLESSEYIDCLNHGLPKEFFTTLGFEKKSGNLVIPDFFEPFVAKNVDYRFALKTKNKNFCIFKADSDRDRPYLMQ